jgi:hypothetical protein
MVIKAKNMKDHLGKIVIIQPPVMVRNEQPNMPAIRAKIIAVAETAAILERTDNGFQFRVPINDKNLKIKLADES